MSTFTTSTADPTAPSMSDVGLGTFNAEFAPRRSSLNTMLIFGFLLAVGGGFAILYGALYPELADDTKLPMIIIGAAVAFVGWILIEQSLRRRGLRILLYADGLASQKGNKTETLRWEDVSAVWQKVTKHYTNGVYTGTTHVYTLQTSDGKKRSFNDVYRNVEQLGNTIQNEITKRMLPRALQTYNSGGSVSFGTLALNSQGVSRGNQTLPWNEIQGVELQKGYIVFKKQGKWLRWANIPVATVPNMLVFLTMVDRIVGIKTK